MNPMMQLHIPALMLALALSLACNVDDGSAKVDSDVGPDFEVGEEVDASPDELPVEAKQWCAAGGVATGPGVRLIHCTAPAEAAATELKGSGVRLEVGATRVITR
ncbi:hypothetical protein DL240_14675 [Lujinxingia litoralis]|uniref:PASTA domain-containing protein n=1 Tax=Lujinxingia litoralis TaxID=2211119 RepID=A0A328C529_9DELT|nr:hypothetical protein [Lujinxingia litoralis]RAL20916.1 hypothetical protein DL240_14675 [Lujinxingia litoralis]